MKKQCLYIIILSSILLLLPISAIGERYLKTYGIFSNCISSTLPGDVARPDYYSEWRSLVHWENNFSSTFPTIHISFYHYNDIINYPTLTIQDFNAATVTAAVKWNSAQDSYLRLNVSGEDNNGQHADDEINSIQWIESNTSAQYINCLGPNVQATGYLTTDQNSEIKDYDIICNGYDYNWKIYSPEETYSPNVPDVQAVMTHEFGHLLGIAHSAQIFPKPTMYYLGIQNLSQRNLIEDDLVAVNYLYKKELWLDGTHNEIINLDDALSGVAANSGQIIHLVSGRYYITSNATLKKGVSILLHGKTESLPGATLVVNPGVNFTLEENSKIQCGEADTIIVFGSLSGTHANIKGLGASPPNSYWYGIKLYSGPNALTDCDIMDAKYGLMISNNTSTTTLNYCRIGNCAYGIHSQNTATSNSLIISGSQFFYDTVAIGLVGSWAKCNKYVVGISEYTTSASENVMHGIYVLNSILYLDKVTISHSGTSGVFVTGDGSHVYFSPDGVSRGYNTIENNDQDQVTVYNGGYAYIGEKARICDCPRVLDKNDISMSISSLGGGCDPNLGCHWIYMDKAGYNTISMELSGNYLITNNSWPILAELTYWNPCPPSDELFVGTVDRNNPLCPGYFSTSKDIDCQSVMPRDSFMVRLIAYYKDVIAQYPDSSDLILHFLYPLVGPDGQYKSSLGMNWDQYLSQIIASTSSLILRNHAIIMKNQGLMAQKQYSNSLQLLDDLQYSDVDNNIWWYRFSQKILANLGLNNLSNARQIFIQLWRKSIQLNPMGTRVLGEMLDNFVDYGPGGQDLAKVPKMSEMFKYDKPATSNLYQNFPNPFNPVTTLFYDLQEGGWVKISIFNTLGQEVKVLFDGYQDPGYKSVDFDASNLPSGIYFSKLQTGKYSAIKKMVLTK